MLFFCLFPCLLLHGKTPRAASSLKCKQGLGFFFLDFNLMTLVCFLPLGLLLIPDNHVTPRLCDDRVWPVTTGGVWDGSQGSPWAPLGENPTLNPFDHGTKRDTIELVCLIVELGFISTLWVSKS